MKHFNFPIIIRFLGLTCMVNGFFMLLSAPFSWYHDEAAVQGILLSGFVTINLGFMMWYLTRKASKNLRKREGYMIVTFGWLMLTLTGTLPYLFTGTISHFVNAVFEAISGYSTTGASILNDIESLPKGILFWRSSTHWIGGMGIIVLVVAVLPLLGIGGMQLFMAEAPGPSTDKLHPRIAETAKRLWFIYFLLTSVEFMLLKLAGMTWFDAINHAMATVSTGGFSTKNASIAHWNHLPVVQYIIIVFMFMAGTNFVLSYFALKGKVKKTFHNEEFKYYFFGILGFVTLTFVLVLCFQSPELQTIINHSMPYGKIESALRHSAFQVVAIVTTTGFVSADYTMWSTMATLLFFALFFVGGSAGSTAGGVKIVRHIIIIKNAFLEFKKLLHPHAIIPVHYNGQGVQQKVVFNILSFFVLYMGIFIVSAVLLSFMGLDFTSSLGVAASSLGNIGPAFGKVGPVNNYAGLTDMTKSFCAFLMLIGRLELFTVLVLFTPFFWRKS